VPTDPHTLKTHISTNSSLHVAHRHTKTREFTHAHTHNSEMSDALNKTDG